MEFSKRRDRNYRGPGSPYRVQNTERQERKVFSPEQRVQSRVGTWLRNHSTYMDNQMKRASFYNSPFKDNYVADSSSWLERVTAQKMNFDKEADAIVSYMDKNKNRLDPKFMENVRNELASARGQQDKVVRFSTDESRYWGQFKDADDYSKYRAEVREFERRKQEADEMRSFDTEKGRQEISELERERSILMQKNNQQYAVDNGIRQSDVAKRISEIDDEIAKRNSYLTRAGWMQKAESMANVGKEGSSEYDPEFNQYTGYKKDEKTFLDRLTSTDRYGIEDPTYEYINDQNGMRDFIRKDNVLRGEVGWMFDDQYSEKGYDLLTNDEKRTYNYYHNKFGKEKADEYLKTIQEDLNTRVAEKHFSQLDDQTFAEMIFGGYSGLQNFEQGVKNYFSSEDYIPYTSDQILSSKVREDVSEKSPLYGLAYDAVTTTANMAPSILTSTAVGILNPAAGAAVGNALMGTSAAGTAYQEALNEGHDKDGARGYATLVGLSEVLLQYILGGIGKLGGKASGHIVSKIANNVDNAVLRTGVKMTGNMLSEATEEGLQEILEPWMKNAILSTDESVNAKDVAYSALLGGLTAGFLDGPSTIAGEVNTYKEGRKLQDQKVSAERLKNLGSLMSADSVAYKLAGKVDENTGAYTLGRLFNEIGAEVTDSNKRDISRLLQEKGIEKKDADSIAENFGFVVDGMPFTPAQQDALNTNEIVSSVLTDYLFNQNTTYYQRTNGLMELAEDLTGNKEKSNEKDTSQKETVKEPVGKTILQSGETVELDENPVFTNEKGKQELKLKDGRVVDSSSVSLGNESDTIILESIKNLGLNPSASNILYRAYDPSQSAEVYAKGISDAVKYGELNIPSSELNLNSAISSLNEKQKMNAYRLGQMFGNKQVKAQPTVKSTGKGKVTYDSTVDMSKLNESQKTQIKVIEKLADFLTLDVELFSSPVNEEGQHIGINGKFDPNTGKISLDVNAGTQGKDTMLFTLSHELTHRIRSNSPKSFKKLADFLMAEYGKAGESVTQRIDAQIAKSKNKLTIDGAYEEFVADSMESMLADPEVYKKLQKLKKYDKSLWQKFKDFIQEFADKVRAIYKDLSPDSKEGQFVKGLSESLDEIQSLFAEGLVESSGKKSSGSRASIFEEFRNNETNKSPFMDELQKDYQKGMSISDLEKRKSELLSMGRMEENSSDSYSTSDYTEKGWLYERFIKFLKENGNEETKFSGRDSDGNDLSNKQKDFFADSKIRNDKGELLVMYHGTTHYGEITKFKKGKKGWLGPGIYFTDRKSDAERYANEMGPGNGSLYKTYIFSSNPLIVKGRDPNPEILLAAYGNDRVFDRRSKAQGNSPSLVKPSDIKKLQEKGYDGIMWDFGGSHEVSVFSPNQIKSVTNKEPTKSDDIRYSDRDSTGNLLSPQQQEFFKDSKVRDEEGRLIPVYHGTENGGFTEFSETDDIGYFFTSSSSIADTYSGGGEDFSPKKINSWEEAKDAISEIYDDAIVKPIYSIYKKTYYGEKQVTEYFDSRDELLENYEPEDDEFVKEEWNVQYDDYDIPYDSSDFQKAVDEAIDDDSRMSFNYRVYLNLKNPLIIDGKGDNWDDVHDHYNGLVSYDELTDDQLQLIADNMGFDGPEEVPEYEGEIYDPEEGYIQYGQSTRDWVQEAQDMGADGVIFKNIVDEGKYGRGYGYESNVYVAMNPEQIKSIDNKAPTNDPDIRYSDRAYMEAVESGDMDKAQEMVDEAARNSGFEIKAFHGSPQFGFTVFNPTKSDDRRSLFFTNSKKVASSYNYSGKDQRQLIGKPFVPKDNYTQEEAKEIISEYKKYWNRSYETVKSASVFTNYLSSDSIPGNEKTVSVDKIHGFSEGMSLNQMRKELYDTEKASQSGIYGVYLKMKNPFIVNGNGKRWNHIDVESDATRRYAEIEKEIEKLREKADAIEDRSTDEYDALTDRIYDLEMESIDLEDDPTVRGEMTTREVSEYADRHGFDGVIFNNLHDSGGRNIRFDKENSDVYIVFNGKQVKSADPVTYDDSGNVIPLSERFNEREKDIRYSLREVDPVQPTSDAWKRTIDTEEAKRRFPNLWDVTADDSEVRNPTQISSTVKSYRKIFDYLKNEGFNGTILDASSGMGYGTKAGREEYGFDIDDIEPYPDKRYNPKYRDYSALDKKYDVIISNAVLNVLPQDQRDALAIKMGELLKPGGRMFVNTRSKDVDSLSSNKDNVNISPMEWYVSNTGSYQKGFKKSELVAYLQDALGPDFEVTPTNLFGAASVIAEKKGDVLYSDRDENLQKVNEALKTENEKLKEDTERLKELVKLQKVVTGGKLFTKSSVDTMAGHLRKLFDSTADKAEISQELDELYRYIASGEELTWEGIKEKANHIVNMLYSDIRTHRDSYANEVLSEIHGRKIALNDTQKAEAASMSDGYGNYRKSLMGTVILTDNANTSLDSFWQEMSDQYPDIFDSDITSSAMPSALYDAIDTLKNMETGLFMEYSPSELKQEIFNEIYDGYWRVSTLKTVADAKQKEINKLKGEHYAKVQKIRQETKDKIAEIRKQKAEAIQKAKEVTKAKADEKISKLKESYREKRKTAVDNYRERTLRKAQRDKLQKLVLDTAKWISYPKKGEPRCPDVLKEPYGNFLKSIDLSSQRKASGGDPTLNDIRVASSMGTLANTLERIVNSQNPSNSETTDLESGYIDLPAFYVAQLRMIEEDIKNQIGKAEYSTNDMTSEQIKELNKMIRTLNHSIKEMDRVYENARFHTVTELGKDSTIFLDSLGESEKADTRAKKTLWVNSLPFYAFKRFGKAGESIFTELMNAQDKLARLADSIFKFRDRTWKDGEAKTWSEDYHDLKLPNGNKIRLSSADAMSIYCLSRREQGLQHLLGGGVRIIGRTKGESKAKDSRTLLDVKDINAIIKSLSKRQIAVADSIQNYFSTTCSDWGNEISMKRFLTKDFTEKYYFPIESNDEVLPTKDPTAQQSDLFRLLNISATKPLTKKANNQVVIRNIFDVFVGHTSDMARLNSFGMALLDYMKWLNYRDKSVSGEGKVTVEGTRVSMDKAYGSVAYNYVLNLVKDINGRPSDTDPTGLSKWMRRAKTAAVGSSLRVATLQITAYPRASLILSPKSLILGLRKLPKIKMAQKYCGIALWKSFGFYDTNISRTMEEQIKGTGDIRQKLIEWSLKGAELGDALTWGCLWNACEYEVGKTTKNKIGSEEFYIEVGKKLREVVYSTQVVDSVLTRSQMMRSKNAVAKEFSSFMSEPTLSANILMDAGFRFREEQRITGSTAKAWKKTGAYISRAVSVYSLTAMAAAVVEAFWDAWRDEDDKDFKEKYLNALLENSILDLNPLSKVPVISDYFDSALSYFGLGYYSNESMYSQHISKVMKALSACKAALNGTGTAYNALYKTAMAISSMVGVSVSGPIREAVDLWNNTAGAADPTKKILKYARKKSETTDLLLDAYIEGDEDKADALESTYTDDKNRQESIRGEIKERYESGEITKEKANELLQKYGGKDSNDAYWVTEEWEDGEDWTKYDDLYSAVETGNNLKGVIKEYQSRGVSDQSIRTAISNHFKPIYISKSKAERARLKGYLKNGFRLSGMEKDAIEKKLDQWDMISDVGQEVYTMYEEGTEGMTRKDEKVKVIAKLPISKKQKDMLYMAEGWSKKELNKTPWH